MPQFIKEPFNNQSSADLAFHTVAEVLGRGDLGLRPVMDDAQRAFRTVEDLLNEDTAEQYFPAVKAKNNRQVEKVCQKAVADALGLKPKLFFFLK